MIIFVLMNKRCRKCGEIKKLSNFHKDKSFSDGYRSDCKECRKNLGLKNGWIDPPKPPPPPPTKEELEARKERARIKKLEWKKKNKEYIKKKEKERRSTDRYKAKCREYAKKYREKYPEKVAGRKLLYNCLTQLKGMGTRNKNIRATKVLGYDYEKLKLRMEVQFKEGMSWDNHGEWHIDHIKPVSSFKPGTPLNIINALCNLQPLWAYENMSKSNKF